jgi:hypothetical protein
MDYIVIEYIFFRSAFAFLALFDETSQTKRKVEASIKIEGFFAQMMALLGYFI